MIGYRLYEDTGENSQCDMLEILDYSVPMYNCQRQHLSCVYYRAHGTLSATSLSSVHVSTLYELLGLIHLLSTLHSETESSSTPSITKRAFTVSLMQNSTGVYL